MTLKKLLDDHIAISPSYLLVDQWVKGMEYLFILEMERK